MTYDREFYDRIGGGSLRSARVVAPLIRDLVPTRTVIDVGCGTGAWAYAFQELGSQVLGVDGSWVPRDQRLVPFVECDLAQDPFGVRHIGRYDLAVSLEVGEHLPFDRARDLVALLVHLGDAVLFSAAVPGQGGANHINEQWPEWWAELFAERGYLPGDVVRPAVKGHPDVEWWYARNTFLYAPWAMRL